MGEFGGGTASGDVAATNVQAGVPERCNMLDDFFTASMAKDSPAHRQLHKDDDQVRSTQPPVWDGVIAPPSPRDNDRRESGAGRKQRADPEQLPGWAQGREPPPVRAKPRAQPRPDAGGPPARGAGGPASGQPASRAADAGGPPARGAGGPAARQRNSYGAPANDAPSGERNYARPWRDNAPPKEEKNTKGAKGGEKEKKGAEEGSFLEKIYV